ncbi:hypothetical protein LOTGIDRAFT_231463 [Lottia gigantea]|uniref:RING-type domain-containing protein n=1 Tax=Lottia gigantea TaxID=225164 RepID=V4AXW2_LOTGI|nr:hypothetical protein LOTGIDRAFT_231463 [Lottia gigantea]ESO98446.1 hypothetical protein LOTGIDRAFT_231463 [Lottia gigantea]
MEIMEESQQQCEQIVQHRDQQLHQQEQQFHQQRLNTRQQFSDELEDNDSPIDQQYGQLVDLNLGLQTVVSRHEEREVTPVQETSQYQQEFERCKTEIEWQKQKIEAEIQNYEKEISVLCKEYTRLKQQGGGEKPRDSNRICLFCVDEDRSVLFEPCRHVCCCASCVSNFKNKPCPVCRVPVQSWQVVFLN